MSMNDAWPQCAQASRSYWITTVETYMRRCMRLQTSARASELAHELNISPSTIARHFKSAVGISISDYMKHRQIEYAKELLANTESSASTVALVTGWGTTRTFFRAFRKATGITPAEYRRRKRNVSGASRD